jgi:hypothetical protein
MHVHDVTTCHVMCTITSGDNDGAGELTDSCESPQHEYRVHTFNIIL